MHWFWKPNVSMQAVYLGLDASSYEEHESLMYTDFDSIFHLHGNWFHTTHWFGKPVVIERLGPLANTKQQAKQLEPTWLLCAGTLLQQLLLW